MLSLSDLPTLNAALNATAAALLATGYGFIRRKNVAMHKRCMVSTVIVSGLFLTSYLVYHFQVGSVRFRGQGWIRPVYFSILISHTILAVSLVPLVTITLTRALRGQFDRHRAIARWTLPIWMYVSVTGVIVYWLLYHAYAAR